MGKKLRDACPRESHAEWKAPAGRPDPVNLVLEADKGRNPELLPLRHGRMALSPFTFYRGSALNMAMDLATTPATGVRVQSCGDAHLGNFRGLGTPERRVIFAINDLDETLPAPWEWDLKRLAASFVVACRNNGLSESTGREAVLTCVRSYRERMAEFSEMNPLDRWYFAVDSQMLLSTIDDPEFRKRGSRRIEKERTRRIEEDLFPTFKRTASKTPVIADQLPTIFHVKGHKPGQIHPDTAEGFALYRDSVAASTRALLDQYELKDAAMKVVGVGSGGTYCAVLLLTDGDGSPLVLQVKEARASHEPLFEATQIKGDGETTPFLSTTDEFADFERWDFNMGRMERAQNSVLHGNYVRSALKLGLELDARLGANPYQSGLIGGNDAHVGVVTTRQDNFVGEFANGLPSPTRWKTPLAMVNNDPKKGPLVLVWNEQAAGLGGVWARENTREAIWDALKRKEVYATTGDRPTVRVFAGFDFLKTDLDRPDFAANGYAHGVPMGGSLKKAPAGKAQERIFDVAVSGARKIGADGRCKTPVGSTVDVANASYTNIIGAAMLSAAWKDPAFDAGQRAFYYVRLIQIPSPRWTAYDQKRYGIKMADYVPMTVTNRAYTSPIWYTPAAP